MECDRRYNNNVIDSKEIKKQCADHAVTPACALGPKRPRCDSIWSHLAYISYLMSCFALLIFPLILPFSYRNCFVYKHCTGSRIQGASTELCSDTTDFPLHLAAGNLPPLTFPIHALGHTNSHALTSAYNAKRSTCMGIVIAAPRPGSS
jgi:hypothetical protein